MLHTSTAKRTDFLLIGQATIMDKSLGTLAFLWCFPIHAGPTPPLTPQTKLDAYTGYPEFFPVSTLYRVEGGRTARKFQKQRSVL